MNIEKIYKLLKNKTKLIAIKLNPELVTLLDKTIQEDDELKNRNDFIERSIIKYLNEKGCFLNKSNTATHG
jgi:metal-responsive CopG/Arc/MetJ family transcriptional regulator